MSERKDLALMLSEAHDELLSAARHMEEALEYMDRYQFLGEDNPFLKRLLQGYRTETETLAAAVWRQRRSVR